MTTQLSLPYPDFQPARRPDGGKIYRERLVDLLTSDLDFHDEDSRYASHDFHAFPAKFPPQLPRKFIDALTTNHDLVLDPMMGSGTTILEAYLAGRKAIGFDIDPLASRITRVKVSPLARKTVEECGHELIRAARASVSAGRAGITRSLELWRDRDAETAAFINEWFDPDTQVELMALKSQIEAIEDVGLKAFFELVLSAIIITKSGGVSLALDLAHTRPHKPKVIRNRTGEVVQGQDALNNKERNAAVLTKTLRSPLDEFEKRFRRNLASLPEAGEDRIPPDLQFGSAEELPLEDESVDLIVTSPPYASNAIDYMRAHKFSLVWLGHSIAELSRKRREYIGSEVVNLDKPEKLPASAAAIVDEIATMDKQKGRVLHLYYSQMTRVLRRMYAVLRPDRAAIVVVGTSLMRGRDTETQNCLAAIGEAIGFDVPVIGERNLDRDRRMLPAGMLINRESQIQQRMHGEYVIGFFKP